MNIHHPVLWTEGLFLRPQHFQQQDRHHAWQLHQSLRALSPWAWGWQRLKLDAGALQIGRIALAEARGVMPDGLAFDLETSHQAPAALELPLETRDERIVLAWPLSRKGLADSDVEALSASGDGIPTHAVAAHHRWRTMELDLPDIHAAAVRSATVQLGSPDLRLMRARDCDEGLLTLEVCHVTERQHDQALRLDPTYIPPLLDVRAHPALPGQLTELAGLVRQRAHALAERFSARQGVMAAELTDLLRLTALNRAAPQLDHWCADAPQHPLPLYQGLAVLMGELATHADARVAATLPPYRHEQLRECFAPLMSALRQHLSQVLERHATPIPLTPGPQGVQVATLGETAMLRSAQFVLTVEAQWAPETLRTRLPSLIRIASADRLLDLLALQLPGVPVQPLPVAPRQLPFQADQLYFSVDGQGHALWEEVTRSGTLALHVAGDIPGLALQMWALRS